MPYKDGIGALVTDFDEEERPLEVHWGKIAEAVHSYARDPGLVREAHRLQGSAQRSFRS